MNNFVKSACFILSIFFVVNTTEAELSLKNSKDTSITGHFIAEPTSNAVQPSIDHKKPPVYPLKKEQRKHSSSCLPGLHCSLTGSFELNLECYFFTALEYLKLVKNLLTIIHDWRKCRFIDSAKELRRVDSEAFRKLPNLRKIRISNCPNLEVWNGILLKENFKIQSVIARNNGLKQLPRLQMFPNQHFLTIEMLDFSFNNIQAITTGSSLNVNAKVLKLENNAIARVEPFAFVGCKFLKLWVLS
uniref:Leucine-rich repeat domain-containing protein n=1 Tax=Ditylenchus dipsaci TaxID=166011 RepID=A0A915CPF7_9BILA